jgi:hypothetical protein
MPQALNTKAAEHHEAAAKCHRSAAELHGKRDDNAGVEHSANSIRHRKQRFDCRSSQSITSPRRDPAPTGLSNQRR